MPVVDTEVIFALKPSDPKHQHAMNLLQSNTSLVAPDSAIFEFQIVLRGRGTDDNNIKAALGAVHEVLLNHNVTEIKTIDSNLLMLQCDIEDNYHLSYFDSLIAASALFWDQQIVSDDDFFDRVPNLERIPLTRSDSD
jgi:predicted nucleic acid-binding protein